MLKRQILMATYIMTLNLKPQTYENHDTKRKSMAVVELLWNFIRKI